MKTRMVHLSNLIEIGRWRADLHVHLNSEIRSEKFSLVNLGDVVIESKEAKNPKDYGQKEFYYIGLENVEQLTGEVQGISLTTCDQVRSRSKVFEQGDILYGKLRPYLRKALYIEAPYSQGLCSTEFVILKTKLDLILPLFLREILVSESVTDLVTRMQGGSALPRVSSKDLLNISIPLPSLDFQKECVYRIERARKQRRELLLKINTLSEEGQKIIANVFS